LNDGLGKSSDSQSSRLMSIDALRGFDMFWIMGGDDFFALLLGASSFAWAPALKEQLEHVEWEGFRFYDLIFPLFLFLVGCAIPFSLEKYRGEPGRVYARILRRTVLLIAMGLIYNQIQALDWKNVRWMGVLQRIGICYGVTAILFVQLKTKDLIALFVGILLAYWAMLTLVPVPGGSAGVLTPSGNLAGYIDRAFLPGKIFPLYYGHGDNEGLLSTLPAIATTLLGVFSGMLLQSKLTSWGKASVLALAGIVCVVAGDGWGNIFPIIKNLWTSSFVLYAGGWSMILLAIFYTIIDVIGWRSWAWIWVVIGANAITIYLAQRFISFEGISKFLFGGVASLSGNYKALVLAGGVLVIKWALLAFMYRHRIFLRF
jgi:predicted acyltransferase